MRQSTKRVRRIGFTLVELLVVIAIIGVLSALTAAGVFSWVNGQKRRNTENTIRTVYQTLRGQWSAVIAEAKKESIPDAVYGYADNDPDRARILWIKTRLMEAFPVRYAEVQNAYSAAPLNWIPAGRRKSMATYQKTIGAASGQANPAAESSACLLLAIAVQRGGTALNADSLGSAVADSSGDGIKEIVDGFGNPLHFYRFATGNVDLESASPAGPNKDGIDPRGSLRAAGWSKVGDYPTKFHRVANGASSYYVVPVIVSAGADSAFGLNAAAVPYDDFGIDGANASKETDNLYSYKLGGTP